MKIKQNLPKIIFALGVIALLVPVITIYANTLSLWPTRWPTTGGAAGDYNVGFRWNWNIENTGSQTITGTGDPDTATFYKGAESKYNANGGGPFTNSNITQNNYWAHFAQSYNPSKYLSAGNYYWHYTQWNITTNVSESSSDGPDSYPEIEIF